MSVAGGMKARMGPKANRPLGSETNDHLALFGEATSKKRQEMIVRFLTHRTIAKSKKIQARRDKTKIGSTGLSVADEKKLLSKEKSVEPTKNSSSSDTHTTTTASTGKTSSTKNHPSHHTSSSAILQASGALTTGMENPKLSDPASSFLSPRAGSNAGPLSTARSVHFQSDEQSALDSVTHTQPPQQQQLSPPTSPKGKGGSNTLPSSSSLNDNKSAIKLPSALSPSSYVGGRRRSGDDDKDKTTTVVAGEENHLSTIGTTREEEHSSHLSPWERRLEVHLTVEEKVVVDALFKKEFTRQMEEAEEVALSSARHPLRGDGTIDQDSGELLLSPSTAFVNDSFVEENETLAKSEEEQQQQRLIVGPPLSVQEQQIAYIAVTLPQLRWLLQQLSIFFQSLNDLAIHCNRFCDAPIIIPPLPPLPMDPRLQHHRFSSGPSDSSFLSNTTTRPSDWKTNIAYGTEAEKQDFVFKQREKKLMNLRIRICLEEFRALASHEHTLNDDGEENKQHFGMSTTDRLHESLRRLFDEKGTGKSTAAVSATNGSTANTTKQLDAKRELKASLLNQAFVKLGLPLGDCAKEGWDNPDDEELFDDEEEKLKSRKRTVDAQGKLKKISVEQWNAQVTSALQAAGSVENDKKECDFYPCQKFEGRKAGYFFGKSYLGQGYYRDVTAAKIKAEKEAALRARVRRAPSARSLDPVDDDYGDEDQEEGQETELVDEAAKENKELFANEEEEEDELERLLASKQRGEDEGDDTKVDENSEGESEVSQSSGNHLKPPGGPSGASSSRGSSRNGAKTRKVSSETSSAVKKKHSDSSRSANQGNVTPQAKPLELDPNHLQTAQDREADDEAAKKRQEEKDKIRAAITRFDTLGGRLDRLMSNVPPSRWFDTCTVFKPEGNYLNPEERKRRQQEEQRRRRESHSSSLSNTGGGDDFIGRGGSFRCFGSGTFGSDDSATDGILPNNHGGGIIPAPLAPQGAQRRQSLSRFQEKLLRRQRSASEAAQLDFLSQFEFEMLKEERSLIRSILFVTQRYVAHLRTKKSMTSFQLAVTPGVSDKEVHRARLEVLKDPVWQQWRDRCDGVLGAGGNVGGGIGGENKDNKNNNLLDGGAVAESDEEGSRAIDEMVAELDEMLVALGVSLKDPFGEGAASTKPETTGQQQSNSSENNNINGLDVDASALFLEEDEDELLTIHAVAKLIQSRLDHLSLVLPKDRRPPLFTATNGTTTTDLLSQHSRRRNSASRDGDEDQLSHSSSGGSSSEDNDVATKFVGAGRTRSPNQGSTVVAATRPTHTPTKPSAAPPLLSSGKLDIFSCGLQNLKTRPATKKKSMRTKSSLASQHQHHPLAANNSSFHTPLTRKSSSASGLLRASQSQSSISPQPNSSTQLSTVESVVVGNGGGGGGGGSPPGHSPQVTPQSSGLVPSSSSSAHVMTATQTRNNSPDSIPQEPSSAGVGAVTPQSYQNYQSQSHVSYRRNERARPGLLGIVPVDHMEFPRNRWKKSKQSADFSALWETEVPVPTQPSRPIRPPPPEVKPPTIASVMGTLQRAGVRRLQQTNNSTTHQEQ